MYRHGMFSEYSNPVHRHAVRLGAEASGRWQRENRVERRR